MNNNEVKNVENKQNNSLMRKTKAQLVDIILRKDIIEKNLRADIKDLEANLNKYKDNLNKYENKIISIKTDYAKLNEDYKDICDEKVSIECNLKSTISKQNRTIWILAIMLVISFITNILICF